MRTRRRVGSTLVAMTLVALAACSPGGGSGDSDQPAGDPVSGGILRFGTNGQEGTCLDPHGTASTTGALTAVPFSDSLIWQTKAGKLEPWLADSWDISPDGLTYTFHLRKGVTFTDGSTWNADALKINLDHMVDPATKSPLAASYIDPYVSTTVVDEYTAQVTLSTPYSAFLNVLAQGYLGMISPKQITEAPDTICDQPIGSGPFIVKKWTKGEGIEYTRNPDYNWGPPGTHEGPAYLDGIHIFFVAEDSTRYNTLASHDLDAIEFVPPQNYDTVKQNSDLEFFTEDRPGHPYSLWFNTSRAPFDDVRVREALLDAVDREAIVQSISFKQWHAASTWLTPSTPGYTEDLKGSFTYDPDKANQLLDDAGWTEKDSEGYRTKDGKRLTAVLPMDNTVPLRVQIAEQTQAAAKEVGIEIVIQFPPTQELSDRQANGDYDLSSGLWSTNTRDVLWIRYSSANITTPERRGLNGSFLNDPELDGLLQDARETIDPSEQDSLYDQAEERLYELSPGIPFYSDPRPVANWTNVEGLTYAYGYLAPYFFDTWLAK